jgi:hypothetical protein
MTTVVTVSLEFDDMSGVSNVTSGYATTLPLRFNDRYRQFQRRVAELRFGWHFVMERAFERLSVDSMIHDGTNALENCWPNN